MDQRLVIPNGGMPLEGDDFVWMQDGIDKTIRGVFEDIAARVPQTGHPNTWGNFIISGCEVTDLGNSLVAVTEGYVYIEGEILYTPAVASVSTATGALGYIKHVYFDPAGQEVMQNGSIEHTYEVRRAQLTTFGASPTQPTVFLTAFGRPNRYKFLLLDADVESLHDTNVINTIDSNWYLSGGASLQDPILVTKQVGRVNFRGTFEHGAQSVWGAAVFNLQAAFRPVTSLYFLCPFGDDGIVRVVVEYGGDVKFYQIQAPSTGFTIHLDGINYTIE